MVELLKQGQYSPFSVERQAASIWAGTTGKMDSIPVADIRRFEAEFLDFIARERKQIFDVISSTRELTDDTVKSFDWKFVDLQRVTVNALKSSFIPFEERLEIIEKIVKPTYLAIAAE